jgi:hypothetical protein
VAFFRHEVKAQDPVGIGRLVREAAIPGGIVQGSAIVGRHCNPQKAGMRLKSPDLIKESCPSGISRATDQTKAATQVGAAGDRFFERCTGELGMPRREPKLEVEVVLEEAAAGHLRIIDRSAFDPKQPSFQGWSCTKRQGVHHEGECWRTLPPTGVVEVIPGECRAPVFQHTHEPPGR